MKKINKSLPPNPLSEYAGQYPENNWNDFYNTPHYKEIKTLIFNEQGRLCAFCENEILETHKQRVEHFHPKSDKTNPNQNWALDWTNIIGVCLGGSDVDKSIHPLPANLSCDAYKDYLITTKKLGENCEGHLFNPLHLPALPCLFDFDKRTGKLKPRNDYSGIDFVDNKYGSTTELVEKTIEHLNLNCYRLNQQRLAVFKRHQKILEKARKNNIQQIHSKLAVHWFQKQWLPFFTTRRILLGNHAENYLANTHYNG